MCGIELPAWAPSLPRPQRVWDPRQHWGPRTWAAWALPGFERTKATSRPRLSCWSHSHQTGQLSLCQDAERKNRSTWPGKKLILQVCGVVRIALLMFLQVTGMASGCLSFSCPSVCCCFCTLLTVFLVYQCFWLWQKMLVCSPMLHSSFNHSEIRRISLSGLLNIPIAAENSFKAKLFAYKAIRGSQTGY